MERACGVMKLKNMIRVRGSDCCHSEEDPVHTCLEEVAFDQASDQMSEEARFNESCLKET